MSRLTDSDVFALFLEALASMMSENTSLSAREMAGRDKPYPRRCPECWEPVLRPAVIAYDAEVRHDGCLHKLHIADLQVDRCDACRQVVFTNRTDEQISQALREQLGLLSPEEIRNRLAELGLLPEHFGARIGVPVETVANWLCGAQVQSRAMDNLMRVFLDFDDVRAALSGAR